MNPLLQALWNRRADLVCCSVIFVLPFLRIVPVGVTLAQVLAVLGSLLLLATPSNRVQKDSHFPQGFALLVVLFVFWVWICTALGVVRGTVVPLQGVRDLRDFGICAFFLLALLVGRHTPSLPWLIMAGTGPIAIELLLRRTSLYTVLFHPPFQDIRFQAGFLSPNEYAAYAGIIGAGAVALVLRGRVRHVIFIVPFLVSLYACFTTHSRGGLGSFAGAVAVAALLCVGRPYALITGAVLVYGLLAYYQSAQDYYDFFEQVGTRFGDAYLADGMYTRSVLAEDAFNLFLEQPIFGVGWGGFMELGELGIASPHNEYLKVLAESGIVGFLLLGAVFFLPVYRSFRVHDPLRRNTVLVMLAAFYANELFYSHLSRPNLSLIFSILVAVGVNALGRTTILAAETQPPSSGDPGQTTKCNPKQDVLLPVYPGK